MYFRFRFYRWRHICTQWAIWRISIDTAAASDVIASSSAGYSAASCPRRRWASSCKGRQGRNMQCTIVLVWKVRVGGLASAHLLLANNDTAHGRGIHVTECPLVCTCNYVCTLYKLLQCIMCVYQAVCGTAMNACGKFAFTKCGCYSPKLRGGTIDSSQRGA